MANRNWCFTSYDLDLKARLEVELPTEIYYIIFQEEECPTTKKKHLQGYVELRVPHRIPAIRRLLGDPAVHVERRKGNRDQAREYCRKEDSRVSGPWEFGAWRAVTQGARSDLAAIRLLVDAGARSMDIARNDFAVWARNHRAIDAYIGMRDARVRELRNVAVIHVSGDTGSGKSWWAYHHHEDAYRLAPPAHNGGPIWFDGYDGQSTLIIDDFDGWIGYRRLLTLLDPYPCALGVKGATVWARWTTVIITSIVGVYAWYPERGSQELERRIQRSIVLRDRVVVSDSRPPNPA